MSLGPIADYMKACFLQGNRFDYYGWAAYRAIATIELQALGWVRHTRELNTGCRFGFIYQPSHRMMGEYPGGTLYLMVGNVAGFTCDNGKFSEPIVQMLAKKFRIFVMVLELKHLLFLTPARHGKD
ncbi:MAG: hypothetical protein M3Q44_07670 [bacterium]|nr:hypothetical protein [bacterium]